MAGARHEPHSGGSPRLGNPVKPDNLKPLLCDLPLPAKKSKNTRPPPGLTTHQARSMRAPYDSLIKSYANTHTPA